jgi:hypothetical protein
MRLQGFDPSLHSSARHREMSGIQPGGLRYDVEVDARPMRSPARKIALFQLFVILPFTACVAWLVLHQLPICTETRDYFKPFWYRTECQRALFAYGLGLAAIGMRSGAAAVPLPYRLFGVETWRQTRS